MTAIIRRHIGARSWRGLGAALVLITLGIPMSVQAQDYLLGPMDKVRLRIAEWQTATGDLRDWSMLNGDYVVGPAGAIAVPLLGEVKAEGSTTADVATAISSSLQQKFGLIGRPEAALEVTEFRPLYVSGDVVSPGAFPYSPGMTVIKAVSLSGGERRAVSEGLRIDRDLLQAQGGRSVMTAERNRLIARRARLDAELAGKKVIDVPPEFEGFPGKDALIADELAILLADDRRVELQLRSLGDLKGLLEKEVGTLGEKRATLDRQLELFRRDQQDVGSLADRGLVVNTRVSELQRAVSDLESRLLDLDTAALRARQDISEADRDTIQLQNDRQARLAADRQRVDADLAEIDIKIRTQEGLVREAMLIDPSAGSLREERRIKYSITRIKDGQTTFFDAEENTAVEPGDVIQVEIELPLSSTY